MVLTPYLQRAFSFLSICWHKASAPTIFMVMLLVSLVMRLPFLFLSLTPFRGLAALTTADEGIYMLQGRDVLSAHLPYLQHWDNSPPLAWYVYGLLMLLSGGSLTLLRIIGMVYVAVTGYVIYRTLVVHNLRAAVWAAIFYIVFASTMPGGQSVTYEMIVSLPLACIVYYLLNPQPVKNHIARITALFAFCVMIFPAFIYLLPAIALLAPGLRSPVRDIAQWLRPVGKIAAQLAVACFAGYFFFWIIYLCMGQQALFIKTLFLSPVAHMPLFGHAPEPAASWSDWRIIGKYFDYYLHSTYWVLIFLSTCFVLRVCYRLFCLRDMSSPVLGKVFLLICFALPVVAARVTDMPLPHYLKQVLPLLCIAMGLVITFEWRDGRTLIHVIAVAGILTPGMLVWAHYLPLVKYASGRHWQRAYYNDNYYSVARIINTSPLKKHDLYLCGGGEILHPLTHTEPLAYVLRRNPNYSRRVERTFGIPGQNQRQLMRMSNALFMAGKLHGECLVMLEELLMNRYLQVSILGDTAVYVRKDVFKRMPLQLPEPTRDN